MTLRRRTALQWFSTSLAAASLPRVAGAHDTDDDDDDGFRAGLVFTSTNAPAGNELLVYRSDGAGALQPVARLGTQGIGTGAGLGNQGAVTLSEDGRYLFVVNAGSDSVATFAVRRRGLVLTSVVASGGQSPISVAESDGRVFALNAGGAGNVSGLRNRRGVLEPIPGATQPLSAAGGTAPAQVGFGENGRVLIVTEKATNRLTTYLVRGDGRLGGPVVSASSGMTPFGFAVDRRGTLLVSEAFGGAPGASALSSYAFDRPLSAQPHLVSPSVASGQTAACWVVVTPDGRYAYTTNTGTHNISAYAVGRRGDVALSEAAAAATDAGPIDAAVTPHGRLLFVLNAGGHSLQSFAIGRDGALAARSRRDGLPAGATGLAAN